jgi:hypothetical protein
VAAASRDILFIVGGALPVSTSHGYGIGHIVKRVGPGYLFTEVSEPEGAAVVRPEEAAAANVT